MTPVARRHRTHDTYLISRKPREQEKKGRGRKQAHSSATKNSLSRVDRISRRSCRPSHDSFVSRKNHAPSFVVPHETRELWEKSVNNCSSHVEGRVDENGVEKKLKKKNNAHSRRSVRFEFFSPYSIFYPAHLHFLSLSYLPRSVLPKFVRRVALRRAVRAGLR